MCVKRCAEVCEEGLVISCHCQKNIYICVVKGLHTSTQRKVNISSVFFSSSISSLQIKVLTETFIQFCLCLLS